MMVYLYRLKMVVALAICIVALPLYAQMVVVNEYSVSNLNTILDNYQQHEDWIELYNSGSSTANLGGYYMSDDTAFPQKWQFPTGVTIPQHGFLIVWASGRNEVANGNYHTDYRMTQTKADPEWIVFSNPSGGILEARQLEITQYDHSRGRITNGGDDWGIFTSPTPGSTNNNATSYLRYTEKPVMSLTGGFYTGSITVSMTTTEQNAVIRYTQDGTIPTQTSSLYTTPVVVSSTKILKARVFSSTTGVLPGLMEFNTYLMNVNTTLPVVSVSGNQLQTLLGGDAGLIPYGSAEYFNKNKVRTTTSYGTFNKHGQDSWVHPQRSIDYVTRDECGYNYALQEKLFNLSDRDEFQRIILRACGDDNYPGIDTSALLRDDYVETLSQLAGQHLDWRKSERCILYVDGQYWGVYSIREKVPDHDYTQYYYDQGKYDIQLIMLWGGTWAEYGGQQALDDWHNLWDFIINNDMTNQFNYAYVTNQLDITSLVDYFHINSYVVCSDWLNWNVCWWRGLNPEGSHRKWGYTLWDEDATFGHYVNYTGIPAQSPTVPPCFPEGILQPWQDPEGHVTLLNKLRTNPDFTQYYVSRYTDLLNTAFNNDFMLNLLDSMAATIQPEMPAHIARWGGSMPEWLANVQKIRNFITTRNNYIEQGLRDCWDLTGPYNIVINAEPAGVGSVKINSLDLTQFPWEGRYFGGIDVKLSAQVNNPDYEFDKWVLVNHSVIPADTIQDVKLELTMWDSITAVFKPRLFTDSLVINEINYSSAPEFDPGDWVELYNPLDHDLTISDWTFRDSDDQHAFVMPQGATVKTDGYMVVCRDTAKFHSLFPDVTAYIGNMDFGLSSAGELIRLYDNNGITIDTVRYGVDDPWPPEPNGNGPTLELINPAWNNALAESWAASELHGTPGKINGSYVGIPAPVNPNPQLVCRLYPNPFSTSATLFIMSGKPAGYLSLSICNIYGGELRRFDNITDDYTLISRENLSSGIYLYKLLDKNKIILATGKFIVM